MENSCNGPECSTMNNSCDCSQTSPCGEQCNCPGCSGQDSIDFVMNMWHKAGMEALLELKKERIKERIAKTHGPLLDKGADAVADTMSQVFKSMIVKSTATSQLRGKISSILSEITK